MIIIKPQNRRGLIDCNEVLLKPGGRGYDIVYKDIILEHYSTEEKAMRVLDAIQMQIEINWGKMVSSLQGFTSSDRLRPIFQMPQEYEI